MQHRFFQHLARLGSAGGELAELAAAVVEGAAVGLGDGAAGEATGDGAALRRAQDAAGSRAGSAGGLVRSGDVVAAVALDGALAEDGLSLDSAPERSTGISCEGEANSQEEQGSEDGGDLHFGGSLGLWLSEELGFGRGSGHT
jgi:hypothetical protein